MKKLFGMLFVVMMVVTLLAIPVAVSAEAVPTADSGFAKVKWQDNPSSWYLYLQNWGRTPTNAMSRLSGGGLGTVEKNKMCTDVTQCSSCADCATNIPAWGVSLCFANKSWAGADLQNEKIQRTMNSHPNHYGTGCCNKTTGVCAFCSGGDWGVTGCSNPAANASTWCLTRNLATGGSSTCVISK
jgi:hypothetical protein